jgi:hypothetical protein
VEIINARKSLRFFSRSAAKRGLIGVADLVVDGLFDYTESFLEDSFPQAVILFGRRAILWSGRCLDSLLILLEPWFPVLFSILVEGFSDGS